MYELPKDSAKRHLRRRISRVLAAQRLEESKHAEQTRKTPVTPDSRRDSK